MARDNQHHPHTRAVKLAVDDQQRVIDSFKVGPKFMQDPVTARTQATQDAIAASPPAQDVMGRGLPQGYAELVARALTQNGSN